MTSKKIIPLLSCCYCYFSSIIETHLENFLWSFLICDHILNCWFLYKCLFA